MLKSIEVLETYHHSWTHHKWLMKSFLPHEITLILHLFCSYIRSTLYIRLLYFRLICLLVSFTRKLKYILVVVCFNLSKFEYCTSDSCPHNKFRASNCKSVLSGNEPCFFSNVDSRLTETLLVSQKHRVYSFIDSGSDSRIWEQIVNSILLPLHQVQRRIRGELRLRLLNFDE